MEKIDIMRTIRAHGLQAKQVAERLGITVVAMSQHNSNKNPRLSTLQKIAGAIGCEVSDLFYKVDENGNVIEKKNEMDLTDGSRRKLTDDKDFFYLSQEDNDNPAREDKANVPVQAVGQDAKGESGEDGRMWKDEMVQDAREVLCCPKCGTRFVVMHIGEV